MGRGEKKRVRIEEPTEDATGEAFTPSFGSGVQQAKSFNRIRKHVLCLFFSGKFNEASSYLKANLGGREQEFFANTEGIYVLTQSLNFIVDARAFKCVVSIAPQKSVDAILRNNDYAVLRDFVETGHVLEGDYYSCGKELEDVYQRLVEQKRNKIHLLFENNLACLKQLAAKFGVTLVSEDQIWSILERLEPNESSGAANRESLFTFVS